jgi:hypothetical protein
MAPKEGLDEDNGRDADQNRDPLELAEKISMSGTNYDFMVARAMNMACSTMHAKSCKTQLPDLPDYLMTQIEMTYKKTKAILPLASSNRQARASSDAGQAQNAEHQSTESSDVHVISPFELALSSLYVHFVDKNSVKVFNKFDQSYVEAK